jgi:peptide/nickel transport system substrate-binding protein
MVIMAKKSLIHIVLLVLIIIALFSAGTFAAQPLVINLEGGDWGYPTPYAHYSRGPGSFKMRMIFDSLLERGEKGYIPWLAKRWTVTPDGKVYTFILQKNVHWHDGKLLTAEDVKFTFEYFAKYPPVSDELSIDGKSPITKIEIIADRTIRLTVAKPNATILGRLGNVRIIPKHIWEKVTDPKKFNTPEAVIGCGPFRLKAYSRDQGAYQFEAFKGYWGPKPRPVLLQFIPVSDSVLAFEKGEIDLTGIAPDLLSRYKNKKEFKIKRNPAFWGYRLIFNMERRPELKDKQIRQAFAYAVDLPELVDKVARGAAVSASPGYLPVDHRWYNSQVKRYPFEPAKAKALLSDHKFSFDLLVANSRDEVRIGELLKLSLAKAGIEMNVKSVDMKSRDAAVKQGNYELVLIGHGGWGGDPDMLREMYASGKDTDQSPSSNRIRGYFNQRIETLCQKQLYEMNEAKRKKLIFELQELIAEELPQLPLYNTTGYIVYRPAKFDGWKYMFDHHEVTHNKLSFLNLK